MKPVEKHDSIRIRFVDILEVVESSDVFETNWFSNLFSLCVRVCGMNSLDKTASRTCRTNALRLP